jgi:hypothetical protein
MLDTLLLRSSLQFTQLHFTALHLSTLHFLLMEPKGPIQISKELTAFSPSSAKLIQSTLFPFHVFNIHFNIILPSMPRSFKRCLSPSGFPHQYPVHISHFSHISHISCTHHIFLNSITQIMTGEELNPLSPEFSFKF